MRTGVVRACAVALTCVAATVRGQTEIRHRFLCVDNHGRKNQLIHVNQHAPERNWVVALPGTPARDLQLVGQGRVLVSVSTGCQEHDLATGRKVWEITGYRNVNTARRLDDGTTLLGANAKDGITVYTVDRDGKELSKRVLYRESGALRVLRLTPDGNYLFMVGKPRNAVEMTPQGEILWRVSLAPFSGKGYQVSKTAAGHYLASTGDGVKVVQFSPEGKVVRHWGDETKGKHAEWGLDLFSGFDVLPNGNVVIANWLGHGKHGTGPHVVEFNEANDLVWQWGDHDLARQVTNVMVLDGRDEQIRNGSRP